MGNQLSGDKLENAIVVLNHCSIFPNNLSSDDIRRLAKTTEIIVVPELQALFNKMDLSDSIYVLADGELQSDVFFGTTIRPAQYALVGEEASYDEECLRPYTMHTLKQSSVLRVRRDVLLKFASRNHSVANLVREIQLVADRLKVSILSKVPFWMSLAHERLFQLGNVMKYQIFDSQDNICVEGDMGEHWYVLCGGKTAVYKEKDGTQFVVGEMLQGANFGEAALVDNLPRTATVIATCECLVLALATPDYQKFITTCPGVEHALIQTVRQRTVESLKNYNVPLLKSMSDGSMAMIVQVFKIRHALPDEVICNEGEEGNAFFLVVKGELDIRSSAVGFIKRLTTGDYFGEVSMVTDVPRSATIRTVSECTLFEIGKKDFISILEREPQALAEMEIRILKSECQLHSVINHPLACKAFQNMLMKELSEENILFWKAADWFRIIYGSGSSVKFTARNDKPKQLPIDLSDRGSIIETGPVLQLSKSSDGANRRRSRSPPRKPANSNLRRMTSFSSKLTPTSTESVSDDTSTSSSTDRLPSPPASRGGFLSSLSKWSFRGPQGSADLKEVASNLIPLINEQDNENTESASVIYSTSDIVTISPIRSKIAAERSPVLHSPQSPRSASYRRSLTKTVSDSDVIEPVEVFDYLDELAGEDERPAVKDLTQLLVSSGKEPSVTIASRIVNSWDRRRMALKIYNMYISDDATKQINIPFAFKRRIEALVLENRFPITMFEESKNEVYDLMKDPFRRFKTTHAFDDLLFELKAFEGSIIKGIGQRLTSKIVAHARASAPSFRGPGGYHDNDEEESFVQEGNN